MPYRWARTMRSIFSIACKDVRIYFLKGPNLTFGLLLPLVLYWAFAIDRSLELSVVIPGLIGMAILFGAGAIQGVSLPLERRTGTLNALLAAPVTLSMIILGKVLAGVFFGVILSSVYYIFIIMFTSLRPIVLPFLSTCILASLCFSCFGILLATPFQDIPQAMPPATVIRIAIVFSSNTFTPVEIMSMPSRVVAQLMPLTYAVNALRQAVNGSISAWSFAMNLGILILFAIVFIVIAMTILSRSRAFE
jgi:ABC-2 type transport system permease protein